MTDDFRHASSGYRLSALRPPVAGAGPQRLLAATAAAVVLLALMLTFVNVVQAQMVRGEQLRRNWNGGVTATAEAPTHATQLADSAAAPLVDAFRF